MFQPAYGCKQHPKAGRNTQHKELYPKNVHLIILAQSFQLKLMQFFNPFYQEMCLPTQHVMQVILEILSALNWNVMTEHAVSSWSHGAVQNAVVLQEPLSAVMTAKPVVPLRMAAHRQHFASAPILNTACFFIVFLVMYGKCVFCFQTK